MRITELTSPTKKDMKVRKRKEKDLHPEIFWVWPEGANKNEIGSYAPGDKRGMFIPSEYLPYSDCLQLGTLVNCTYR